jgi:hypothetical protein
MATNQLASKPFNTLTLDEKLELINEQQRLVIKGMTGFQTAFSGIQQVFGMLAGNLGELAKMDPAKMAKEADKTNTLVSEAHAYIRKIYTDLYKPEPTVEIKKIVRHDD